MAKSIISIALEEMEPKEPVVQELSDEAVEQDAAEIRAEDERIDTDTDRIEETESIQETIGDTADVVEKRVEQEEPLSEDAAQAIEVAMEHFKARIGWKKPVVAVEGFKDAKTALEASKETLKNLRDLEAKLGHGVAIAQEGLFDRIGNAVVRAFTSTKKIEKNITTAAAVLASKGSKEETLSDVAWGRVFLSSGKKEIAAGDVRKLVSELKKYHRDILPLLKQFNGIISEASRALSASTFVADDAETKKIKQLQIDGTKLLTAVREVTREHEKGTVDAKPLTDREAETLARDVRDMINDVEFNRGVEEFQKEILRANKALFTESQSRFAGPLASDMRAYSNLVTQSLQPAWQVIHETARSEYLVAYGVYKYIKASAK